MKAIVIKENEKIKLVAQVVEITTTDFVKLMNDYQENKKAKELAEQKEKQNLYERIKELEEKVAQHEHQFMVDHGEIGE